MFTAPFDLPPPPDCYASDCTTPSLVHWQRRLTPAEVEAAHQAEQQRRDDRETPFPDGIPLPDPAEMSHLVHACGQHAIGIDAAALIHQKTCSGPDSPALPACDCTPEKQPEPRVRPEQQVPDHWASAAFGM
jgi:hypothetical protein